MPDNYTDKYQPGAITNSMMEAVESCGLKFRVLYIERPQLEAQYVKVLDALSLGVLVHEMVEAIQLGYRPLASADMIFTRVQDWELADDQKLLLPKFLRALEATNAYGVTQRGTPYSAPLMTGYWKKNYGQLEAEIAKMNREIQRPDWYCDLPPMDYLLRSVQCLDNFRTMRPQIETGMECQGVEKTFHFNFEGTTLAGTIDRLDTDEREEWWITDWKTGTKEYTALGLHNLNQPHLYAESLIREGKKVAGFRIGALDQNKLTTVAFSQRAHEVYLEHRLPRLIHAVQQNLATPKELLPVLAGRSWSLGCPCPLAALKDNDPNRCPAVYLED